MKRLVIAGVFALGLSACSGGQENSNQNQQQDAAQADQDADSASAPDSEPTQAESSSPTPSASQSAPVAMSTIPAKYYGVWDAPGPNGCNGASDGVLEIKAQSLQFWESTGTVTSVTPASNGGVDVTTDMVGEGEEWKATHNLRLNGSSLMLATDGGTAYERVRCP